MSVNNNNHSSIYEGYPGEYVFLFPHENQHTLEASPQGPFEEYHNHMFYREIRKISKPFGWLKFDTGNSVVSH